MNVPLAAVKADDTLRQIHQPWTGHDTQVLVMTALGIAIIVLLIVKLKMHGFLALTIGSLFVGIGSGISLADVATTFETGVGAVLGSVGVLIVLGAMLGKLLADSGGADEIVDTILTGGRRSLPWRMALIAFVIGIPMFFEIGLVLLIPVIMLAIRRSKVAAMSIAIPALAGLSVLRDRHSAAGCGTGAASYFRAFNPVSRRTRFDPDGNDVRHGVPGEGLPGDTVPSRPGGPSHGRVQHVVDQVDRGVGGLHAAADHVRAAVDGQVVPRAGDLDGVALDGLVLAVDLGG